LGLTLGVKINYGCPEKDLKWVTDKLKALGVWISSDPMVSMKANYSEKLLKVRNCLSCWEYRCLSLLRKIVVLKSLTASQLVYILSPELHDFGGAVIFKSNLNKNDSTKFVHISNVFTTEILKIWS